MYSKVKVSTRVFYFIFVFCGIWGSNLPGISLPGFTLYPIRLIVFTYAAWFIINKLRNNRLLIKWNLINIVLFIFLVYATMTVIWSIDRKTSITALIVYVTQVALLYMTMQVVDRSQMLECVCDAFFQNTLLLFILALYESFTGAYFVDTSYFFLFRDMNAFGLYRPKTAFQNINNYSVFLTLVFPIILMSLQKRGKLRYLKMLVGCVIVIIPIILTASRTGMISITITVLLVINSEIKRRIKHKHVWTCLLIAIFVSILVFLSSSIGRVIFSDGSITNEGRLKIWSSILENSLDYAFFGAGIGTAEMLNTFNGIPPHNYFLELYAELGIIGVITIIVLLALMIPLQKPERNRRQDCCLLFVVMFLINSICPSSMQGYYWMWMMWGVVMCCNRLAEVNCDDKT